MLPFFGCLSQTRAAVDPASDYAALFGEDEKKVLATPTTRDDVVFAAKLLQRAAELKDDQALQRYIYERVVSLSARDPAGIDTAVEAAKLIVSKSSGVDKTTWQSKLVDLYQSQYKQATGQKRLEAGEFLLGSLQAESESLVNQGKVSDALKRMKDAQSIAQSIRSLKADELGFAVKELQARQLVVDRMEKLRQRLDTQGGDIALLEQLIVGYLTELDDSQTAAKLAAGHPDKNWERLIKLSSKKSGEQSEEEQLELANWLRQISQRVKSETKAAAITKAAEIFVQLRQSHSKQDARRLQIIHDLDEVAKDLKANPTSRTINIVVYNSHNAQYRERGTRSFNVVLYIAERIVYRRDAVAIDWAADSDPRAIVSVPAIPFDRVRIEVTGFLHNGAALSEVEVWREGKNVALHAATAASAVYNNSPVCDSKKLTDGIANSLTAGSYWTLPDRSLAWAEVILVSPPK